jgi:hypothetical protein
MPSWAGEPYASSTADLQAENPRTKQTNPQLPALVQVEGPNRLSEQEWPSRLMPRGGPLGNPPLRSIYEVRSTYAVNNFQPCYCRSEPDPFTSHCLLILVGNIHLISL